MLEVDALLGHLPAFFANGFTLAGGERREEIVKSFIAVVVPVKLASDAVQFVLML